MKKTTILLTTLCVVIVLGVLGVMLFNDVAVLSPSGSIATEQKRLIVVATLMMLVVVLPVFVMTLFIALKYRESNTKAQYKPKWDGNKLAETLWWGIPLLLIIALSGIIWKSSHELDPFKPLASDKQPLTVQVVALQWKWLFIYPDHKIASVNYLQIPEDRPINFQVTADAPMNSFWIPKLGGQVYAMSGMTTKLHLIASEQGEYQGSSANISGEGFADMTFKVKATSEADFNTWVSKSLTSGGILDTNTYDTIATPGKATPAQYLLPSGDLYDTVVMKYMTPGARGTKTTYEDR